MSKVKQQVFVSYSREPPEESEFARQLARRLRDVGFDAWLDEERILPGADFEAAIRRAIPASNHALVLVTRRWHARPYTRLELNLFAQHPDENCRLVAVKREDFGELELAPQLQQLNVIDWLPDDPEPDARFWLVYCGLTGRPQGPRDQWAEEGRRLSRLSVGEKRGAEKPLETPSEEVRLDCRGRPVLLLPSRRGTLLATDAGECFLLGPSGQTGQEPLPDLQGCAAAVVGPDGMIVVGRYAPMVACLGPGGWEFHSLGTAPVLALAATPHGVAAGDAAGDVTFFPGSGGRLETVRFGEAVVDLCAYENGLAALGAGGTLGRLGWEEEWQKAFEPVALPEQFDRPFGLFAVGKQARVGLIGAEQVAVLDAGSRRVTVGARTFPAGVRQVVYLERRPAYYGVLTDVGELFLLEPDLTTARPVPLPGDTQEVAGICRNLSSGLLAWTAGGALYSISRDRAVRKLAAEDIVLAHADADPSGQIWVVRWPPGKGAHVQPIRPDTAR